MLTEKRSPFLPLVASKDLNMEKDSQKTTPPMAGGQKTTPPMAGGQKTTPPMAGGQKTTPPMAGGQKTTPPMAGGQKTTPPNVDNQVTTPPNGGGQETAAPAGSSDAEGGKDTIPFPRLHPTPDKIPIDKGTPWDPAVPRSRGEAFADRTEWGVWRLPECPWVSEVMPAYWPSSNPMLNSIVGNYTVYLNDILDEYTPWAITHGILLGAYRHDGMIPYGPGACSGAWV